ncbi:intracellular beta-galactosidase BgaD [Xylariomycetidae sp. FL2044]|nr:intracellular beta-galactosidase BgaD [Xylariomycetidae sp. FL2044]
MSPPPLPTKSHPASQPDWNNLGVLHRNTLSPRANFHVYASLADALTYDVARARTQCLSGRTGWKFHHAANPFEAPAGFEDPAFEDAAAAWDDVAVPSMWQLDGYGKGPHYTNVNFPIPVDPPHVPLAENETGSYVRKFTVDEALRAAGGQVRLRFEGVDAAFHVWVNGREVGYHQGSRNPSEFDISDVVDRKEGKENTLAVRVYQYCDATYIEDQDQWRMSGIYRDVYLVGFPASSRIEDVFVQTHLDAQYTDADLKVRIRTTGSGDLKIALYDPTKSTVVATDTKPAITGDVEFSLPIANPAKWTAETPTLYHLVASLDDATFVAQRVGFRQVELKDGLIQVNGRRVVLKGANRHEHHPKFGRAVPYEFMKADLLLMKQHNINAIRTCHQPSDVRLYDLADEMGFWVMDEADLECHGFESICDAALSPSERALPFRERQLLTRAEAAKWTSDNPEWEEAYVDRAEQMIRRDQPHPSVIMWSLGNEAFFGRNHKAMYAHIKAFDASRPIHYEADIYAETMDMYSRMYPPVDEIVEFARDEDKTKPLVLCEYIHAMGNGPGNIKEYVDAFYAHPKLQGGFVWEWANHGLLTKDKQTGEEYYAYGGDFGDVPHDGNFVMDGMLFSDHTPTPGLFEYKKALEPVQVLSHTQQKATIINRYDFVTLDHLECVFAIQDEGKEVLAGKIAMPAGVQPGQTAELDLPSPPSDTAGEIILHLRFLLKESTIVLPVGFDLATAAIPLSASTAFPISIPAQTSSTKALEVKETPQLLTITSATTTWTFAPVHGKLRSLTKNGVSFLASSPDVTMYRAPTDNDEPQDGWDWKQRLLHLAKTSPRGCSWGPGPDADTFVVKVQQRFAPPVLSWSVDLDITYTFSAAGTVSIRVGGVPGGQNLPRTLPRIGISMELPAAWADGGVTWYGRGPGESYRDKKESQRVGVYSVSAVSDLWTDYEFPQEGGNRTDTRWVRFSHSSESESESEPPQSITAQFVDLASSPDESKARRKLFDFNASHYRVADVEEAKHPYELRRKKLDNVVLRLDAAHHGLGSGSCGPRTRDEYALMTEPFEFEVVLG